MMPFEPIRRALSLPVDPVEWGAPDAGAREAAVAVVLRPVTYSPQPELLMIRRAEKEGDPWSGHMAFPGGRREPSDADLLHTARRESMEEVGLDLSQATVLGRLVPIRTPLNRTFVAQMVVHSWAFGLPEVSALRPNAEVASIHWFNLERFLRDEGRGTFTYNWQGTPLELPCVRLDGCFIWGMSLRLVDDIVERLRRGELA